MPNFSKITWVAGTTPLSAPNMQRYDDWIDAMKDANISADGAGKLSMLKLAVAVGTISQIKLFSGTGSVTNVTHGCSSTPDLIIIVYNAKSGDFGTPPTTIPYAYSYTATQCSVHAQSTYNWFGLAIVF